MADFANGYTRMYHFLDKYSSLAIYSDSNSSTGDAPMAVAPKILRLEDYCRPDFTTDAVNLNFDIHNDKTIATSEVAYTRTALGQGKTELVLNAENPNPPNKPYIRSVMVNGWELAEGEGGYVYDSENNELRIPVDSGEGNVVVKIETYLEPQNNAALTGLYKADSTYLTQCEAESFRRITPFLDRPDVMAKYTVRIEADQNEVPVLLSNGNKTGEGMLENGRHWATFHDPFPKPSYLFASANGDLELLEDHYTTGSGKEVALRIWTEQGKSGRICHGVAQKGDEI